MLKFRNNLAAWLLWLSFVSACLFYGVGDNLIMLCASSGLLIGAILLQGPGLIAHRLRARSWDLWLVLWILVVLVVSYLLVSISPESSFAASWVLACIPLWYLAYSSSVSRRLLRLLLIGTLSLFALISVLRFVGSAQRAYEPLLDPNNYASLLYMAWIPLAGMLLQALWVENRSRGVAIAGFVMTLLLCVAIFSTSSRVGAVVVFVALAGWLGLAIVRRFPLMPWLCLFSAVVCAYAICFLRVPDFTAASVDTAGIYSGVSVRGALNDSALRMLSDAPFGTGIFTFPSLYPLYRLPADQSTLGMFVHNDYLQLLLESGPWLVMVLLVIGVATGLGVLRTLRGDDAGSVIRFSLGMAILASLAHATVNFMFYILPLGILFAVLCAEFFSRSAADVPPGSTHADESAAGSNSIAIAGGWVAASLFLVVCWCYLALETVTQGVFGGQPTVSFVREIGRSPESMLRFARFAQDLNGKASVPVLGEALVLEAQIKNAPDKRLEKMKVLALYRRALQLDPFNAFAYESFYRFLKGNMDTELAAELSADESPVNLLQHAIRLDVRRIENVLELLHIYDRYQQPEQALDMLKLSVFPWLERIHWHNPPAARKMLAVLRQRFAQADDPQLLVELEKRAAILEGIVSIPQPTTWFGNWLRSQSDLPGSQSQ